MKEIIYKYSPIWLKAVFLNFEAFSNSKKRYSSGYYTYLEEYNHLWSTESNEYLNFQKDQLKRLLIECSEFVPHYKKSFQELGITLSDINEDPYSVLKKLPFLSKEGRRTEVESLINNNPLRPTISKGYTSGTSGSPTIILTDSESNERSFALWSRYHNNIGIQRGDKNVRFSGRLIVKPTRKKPPFWILNRVDNQLFMSSYHLKESNFSAYVKKLNSFKPLLIDGYPSSIYVLANFINRNKINLEFKPIAISVTAETLYDYQKSEIEKAFQCKVYNQYASSEGAPFITECREGRLHINEDSGIFEFLNKDGNPAKPGEVARLAVTSFRNWKTPLLRYDIQDTVLLPVNQDPCPCGCKMNYIEKIIGREDDLLWTEEKGYVGRMDTAYKGLSGIKLSQLIQKDKNFLIVNQVVDSDYSESMNKLLIQNLKDRLGESINIEIRIVEEIPLSANGKFDAVRREFEIPKE